MTRKGSQIRVLLLPPFSKPQIKKFAVFYFNIFNFLLPKAKNGIFSGQAKAANRNFGRQYKRLR